jgi:hypothetical protein
MTPKTLNKYLLVLFAAGIILSGYIVRYASGWLAGSSNELANLRKDVYILEQKDKHLQVMKNFIASHGAEANILNEVLPSTKDQAKIVRELDSIADKANITIDSVGFPSSSLGSAPIKAPVVATEPNAKPGDTQQAADIAPKIVPKIISQATPLKDIAGVQSIPITLGTIKSKNLPVGATGLRYDDMIAFIRELERNQRIMQTSSIEIGQNSSPNGEKLYTLTISLAVFLRS